MPVVAQANAGDSGETRVVESIRILEYLEDVAPDANPVFDRDANRRAEQKYWLNHIGKRITPYFYRFLKATEAGEYRDDSRDRMLGAYRDFSLPENGEGWNRYRRW